jgi:hypothetical protein
LPQTIWSVARVLELDADLVRACDTTLDSAGGVKHAGALGSSAYAGPQVDKDRRGPAVVLVAGLRSCTPGLLSRTHAARHRGRSDFVGEEVCNRRRAGRGQHGHFGRKPKMAEDAAHGGAVEDASKEHKLACPAIFKAKLNTAEQGKPVFE